MTRFGNSSEFSLFSSKAVGGLKEKLLAALRGGIDIVLIPKENERELAEIPSNIKRDLDIRPVQWTDQVWELALHRMPQSVEAKNENQPVVEDEESAKEEDNTESPTTH